MFTDKQQNPLNTKRFPFLPPGWIFTLTCAALLCIHASSPASEISVSRFLATAKNDLTLKHQDEKTDFLKSSSSNTPFLDRVELRTQTEEFELTQQRYSVRVYPSGFGATKAGKKVYSTTVEASKARHERLLHEALGKRYRLVIDLIHARRMLKLVSGSNAVLADRISVLKKRISTPRFDINDLIEAESDHTELLLERINLEGEIGRFEEEVRLHIPVEGPVEFDTKNLAGVDVIRETFAQVSPAPGSYNIYLRDRRFRMAIAKNRYDLEKAENRKFISFLEASYDNEERHDPTKAYFFELGIRLPFVNPNRLDLNRRKLAYLNEKGRCKELERELSEEIRITHTSLKGLLRQYDALMKQRGAESPESTFKNYMKLEGVDPLVLLELRENLLERDMVFEKICYEIYEKIIDFLELTGKLSEKPLTNYLSATLEQIEQ